MKKILMAMLAITAMVFAGCGKDDDGNGEDRYSAPVIGTPAENGVSGIPAGFSWSTAKIDGTADNCTYQFAISEDGANWKTFDTQKLASYQMSEGLESDKVYYAKVVTTFSDGTVKESDVRKFVSQYSKGLIGASKLTTSSITMEWGSLLPYDCVELSISECSYINQEYIKGSAIETVKVTSGSNYVFENLKEDGKYAIDYELVIGGQSMTQGTYYAMAIDGEKYINDGEFKKVSIYDLGGKTITHLDRDNFTFIGVSCYGKMIQSDWTPNFRMFYGYDLLLFSDMVDIMRVWGYPEDELWYVDEERNLDYESTQIPEVRDLHAKGVLEFIYQSYEPAKNRFVNVRFDFMGGVHKTPSYSFDWASLPMELTYIKR